MDELAIKRAEKFMKKGLAAVGRGEIQVARDSFKASATQNPTADAYTFWGWMEHNLGNTNEAIDLCKQAIEIDPEFGNPYNDIGSYLVAQDKLDEAIPWLEKAKLAKRYEPRQFPYINLGRIYLSKDMHLKALKEFEGALAITPDDHGIAEMVNKLRSSIN